MAHHDQWLETQGHRSGPMIHPLTDKQRAAWEQWIEFHSPSPGKEPPPDPFLVIVVACFVIAVLIYYNGV